jgi:cell wall-associated NlpC family hydrolase
MHILALAFASMTVAAGADPVAFAQAPQSRPGVDAIARTATAYLGEAYVWGDIGRSGYDCSSFVQAVFRQGGLTLPRSSRQQVQSGDAVALENVKPGDLLFFTTRIGDRRISHVGIALSGNRMIHAAKGPHHVVISRWDSRYYLERWVAARRVL